MRLDLEILPRDWNYELWNICAVSLFTVFSTNKHLKADKRVLDVLLGSRESLLRKSDKLFRH